MRLGKTAVGLGLLSAASAARVACVASAAFMTACDDDAGRSGAPEAAAPSGARDLPTAPAGAGTSTVAAAPEPPRAPDIVVDASHVSIGSDRIATGDLGLTDRVAVFLTGRPAVED